MIGSLKANLAKRVLKFTQYVCAIGGLAGLGYWTTVEADSYWFQAKAARQIARESARNVSRTRVAGSNASAILQQLPVNGAVIANLTIPRIGLSTVVVEGDDDSNLKFAAGHIPGTAVPGAPGNVGIAAHRDTFFRPLRLIHRNDLIILYTADKVEKYRVVSTSIVSPDDISVLYPAGYDSLTLVTCYPFHYVGAAPKRFIVRAARTDIGQKNETSTLVSPEVTQD